MYLKGGLWGLGAHQGQGREEMSAANLGAPRIRAGRFMWCLCAVKTLAGKQSNSSLTTLCFEINLNRAVKSILRLYKCFL